MVIREAHGQRRLPFRGTKPRLVVESKTEKLTYTQLDYEVDLFVEMFFGEQNDT